MHGFVFLSCVLSVAYVVYIFVRVLQSPEDPLTCDHREDRYPKKCILDHETAEFSRSPFFVSTCLIGRLYTGTRYDFSNYPAGSPAREALRQANHQTAETVWRRESVLVADKIFLRGVG
jgi:hypothetical protein